jgi:hypothetical protein
MWPAQMQPWLTQSIFFQRCLNVLKNFSSVAAIVAGINSSSVSRLKRTFEQLSAKSQATLGLISRAVDSERNFAHYKSLLEDAIPPAVPFLGASCAVFVVEGRRVLNRCSFRSLRRIPYLPDLYRGRQPQLFAGR